MRGAAVNLDTPAKRIAAGVALGVLVLVVHAMDYRDTVAAAGPDITMDADFAAPYGETGPCKAPSVDKEYRVTLEWCDRGACYRSCSIEPRNEKNTRAKVRRRALISG